MTRMPIHKYRPAPSIELTDRTWPSKTITAPPIWCSVDLRDGNQALIEPMNPDRKLHMFETLVKMDFKEIEVGFPAASQTDYAFVRRLIEDDLIPDDVTIQVLTQARPHLIERTYESIAGARRAIIHLYNSTSTVQRRVVFGLDEAGIIDIAVKGARLCRELAEKMDGTEIVYQYSPESFTQTELWFARDISEAVMDALEPTPGHPMIINLPATVEMATPNNYADQIEWFGRNVKNRESYILSLHPHNDRGTAVAAAELGVMAGADRIEGTLFGNGERTGNVDVVTLALNLFSQGVDPNLVIDDIDAIRETAEYCNRLPVHQRHPYAGELVYTAFSGSHQDAIKKGMAARRQSNSGVWEVPYLPIDPRDLGRTYEAVVRVNSQSGKGGVAYLLHSRFGLELPRKLQVHFAELVQNVTDTSGKEMSADQIHDLFEETYVSLDEPIGFIEHRSRPDTHASERRVLTAKVRVNGQERSIRGTGNGPIDAFVSALGKECGIGLKVIDYHEHALSRGADAVAATYIEVEGDDGTRAWGAGIHANIVVASLKAVTSAANRLADLRKAGGQSSNVETGVKA